MKATMKLAAVAAIALGAATMTSCNKDNGGETIDNGAVRFTAGIEGQAVATPGGGTRAAETAWADGDAIGVLTFHSPADYEDVVNNKYTTTGDGSFTAVAGNEIYFPMDGGTVLFSAYYPWKDGASADNLVPVEIATVQTTANQPGYDWLYAETADGYSKTSDNAVHLEFNHSMSKLVMKTFAGAGVKAADLAGMTVTIKGMRIDGYFNTTSGAIPQGATPVTADITPRTVTDGKNYDAIIMPYDYNSGEVKVEFTLESGDTFTWNMDDEAMLFDGGNEYVYTVTLARTGVTAIGEILPWTTIERGGVTAE